jgi:hypothetical protein
MGTRRFHPDVGRQILDGDASLQHILRLADAACNAVHLLRLAFADDSACHPRHGQIIRAYYFIEYGLLTRQQALDQVCIERCA